MSHIYAKKRDTIRQKKYECLIKKMAKAVDVMFYIKKNA